MKVIQTSSYNLESFVELQVGNSGLTAKEARDISKKLNTSLDDYSIIWYRAVEEEYILQSGNPND